MSNHHPANGWESTKVIALPDGTADVRLMVNRDYTLSSVRVKTLPREVRWTSTIIRHDDGKTFTRQGRTKTAAWLAARAAYLAD